MADYDLNAPGWVLVAGEWRWTLAGPPPVVGAAEGRTATCPKCGGPPSDGSWCGPCLWFPKAGREPTAGDRVRVWPGFREGRSYTATALTGVVVSERGYFGGHPMVRVEKDSGGTDWIAPTHVEVLTPPARQTTLADEVAAGLHDEPHP